MENFYRQGFSGIFKLRSTYVSGYIDRMDRRGSPVDSYRLDDDWLLDIQHSNRTFLGTDRHIFGGYKPNVVHIRRWPHILDDSLVVHQCNPFGMSMLDDRQSPGIHYSVRTAMVRMGFVVDLLRNWKHICNLNSTNYWKEIECTLSQRNYIVKLKYSRWIGSNRQPANGSPW